MAVALFSPFQIRELTFKNRILISPMCEYSCEDGVPSDWHLVHLGSRAVGGAACVIQEATAVSPEGRITPGDFGLWNDEQMRACQRITRFIKEQKSIPAIQLAHAGRKASCAVPWMGGKALTEEDGGWRPILGPSPIPFDANSPVPHELSIGDIKDIVEQFCAATRRAMAAEYEIVEVHAAHGYLLHSFLSPLSNQRADEYGGSLENRMRLTLEISRAVRAIWPQNLPVFVRISASDWVEGGWDITQSVELAKKLHSIGIDLVDASSGGLVPHAKIPSTPGYQVPFAEQIRKHGGIVTGAVGLITEPEQAEKIIASGQADFVLLARESLRDPYWPLHAAHKLGVDWDWPKQYARAKPH